MTHNELLKLLPLLCNPKNGSDLETCSQGLKCIKSGEIFKFENGKLYFIQVPNRNDQLDFIKGILKKIFGKNYHRILLAILGPTLPFSFSKKIKNLKNNGDVVVDLGCGNNRILEDSIGVDLFDYENVDIVCSLENLPFKNESIDIFCSRSVLEHVINFQSVLSEINRCTKVGGKSAHLVPFLFPFHASPHDYRRFTKLGLINEFKTWTLLKSETPFGPFTLFVVNWVEFLSIIFSFGFKKPKAILYLIFILVFSPLKYFDYLFIHFWNFESIAPSVWIEVEKK